ncbi:SURF1 family protein [Aestuariivirga sp.]|uniref:SURF1 family protein n=1 Tax=Aestuariivirga sp. TaxID=2650926 RepID=UPI0039E3690A
MTEKKPRIWPVLLASGLGIAILVGLGVWQIQRLAWKEALIAGIERRAADAPTTMADALARQAKGENIEFLKVSVSGRFEHAREKHVISVYESSPGWEIVTPLRLADGGMVLVDRGVVPANLKDTASRAATDPQGDVTVTGIVKSHAYGRGMFDPDNDPKGDMWFWWDVPAMIADSPPASSSAPFILQLLPTAGDQIFPQPQPPDTGLVNNHLQYAITWFSLAIVLAVIAGLYLRGQMKNQVLEGGRHGG